MDYPRNHEATLTATETTKVAIPKPVTGLLKHCEDYPRATAFIDNNSTAIKAITGVGFFAHFFRIQEAIDAPEQSAVAVDGRKKPSLIRRAGVAGLAWSVVWMGVLTATTLAEEFAHRRVDPVAISRLHKKPWNSIEHTQAEQI